MKTPEDEYRYGTADLPKPKNIFFYTYAATMKLVMYFIFGTGSIGLAILLFPLMKIFLHPQERFRKYARRAVSATFRFFIRLMCLAGVMRVRISDREAFRKLRSKVVVANHPSILDIVYLVSLLPNADCIVRGTLVRTPVVGVIRRFTEAISFSALFVIRNRMNSFVISRSSQFLFTENSREGLSIKYPPSSVMGMGKKE